jgi:glycine hydroxymethyltransferase
MSVSPANGGYPGISHEGVTQFMSRRNLYFSFDDQRMNVKVNESAALIEREKPSLVVFGASFILFPPPVKDLSKVARKVGAKVAYDGAHVLGLIGGGRFQDPLHEGASILIGSTHKSLFGPQGGIILADAQFGKVVKDSVFPSFVDNAHYNRIAALAVALLELKSFGKAYSDQVIKNAKAMGKALDEYGVPVKCGEYGYTESHQVHLDNSRIDSKIDHTRVLEEANIIVDKGTRIGTCEVTRRGMKEKEMERAAELVARVIVKGEQPERVGKDAIKLRQEFESLEYCFKE